MKHAKTATVRPIFKKDDRTKITDYRPVSLINIFSKIYERFLHENFTNFIDTFLSKFISAYRKSYSSNHVLIRLIENWRKKFIDQKKFAEVVLMNLSKAFDSIPHDLSIPKMQVYGFSVDVVTFFYSYLKRWKQNVIVFYTCFPNSFIWGSSRFNTGPLLFNMFINDLYLWVSKTDLLNFADDNTITAAENTIEKLIFTIEQDSQAAVD